MSNWTDRSNRDRSIPLVELARLDERFWSRVSIDAEDPEACWLWTGRCRNGRPTFRVGDRVVDAKQFAWESRRGKIPPRHMIDQFCGVERCMRPGHMVAVIKRGLRKLRDDQVIEIRARYHRWRVAEVGPSHNEICRRIAEDYGISRSGVEMIVTYRRYAHVLADESEREVE